MKRLMTIAMAAIVASNAPTVSAQANMATATSPAAIPDARTAEADLRGLITGLQAGQVDGDKFEDKLANLIRTDIQRQLPTWRSFGAPGAMRLESQEAGAYTFVVTHPLGDVTWVLAYDGGRVVNIGWEFLYPDHLKAKLELWHGLAVLPGSVWKRWMLDLPGKLQSTETCWWVEVAARMECEQVYDEWRTLATYELQGDTVVRTSPNTVPGTYVWHEDGSSTTVHQNLQRPDVKFVERTYYSPELLTTDSQGDDSTRRWVSIKERYPGQADQVLATLSAEHEAAKAAQEQARIARVREEIAAEQAAKDAEYYAEIREEPSSGPDIMGAFMRGLSEGMADNAELVAILYRGNDAYDDAAAYGSGYEDGYDDGYDDGHGGSSAPVGASAAPGSPVTVFLWKGFQVPITPGATSNEGCFAKVQLGPVTTDPVYRVGEAKRAMASAEQQFLAACRQLGELGAGDFADEWYIDERAESTYATMRGNRWMHEVSAW